MSSQSTPGECSQTLMGVAFLWIPYGGALGLTTKQSCKQMWQKIFLNLVSIIFKQIVSVRGGGEETAVISSLSNPLAVYRLWMVLVKLGRDRTCGENDQILSDT